MDLAEAIKRGCLPDLLSIAQWVKLRYPNPNNQPACDDRIKMSSLILDRKILQTDMIQACHDGKLKYEIINDRIPLKKPKLNSSLLWDGISFSGSDRGDQSKNLDIQPLTDFKILKDDVKQFLESIGKIPVDGLLANWWIDELNAETIDAPFKESQTEKHQANSNDLETSSLLKDPQKKDDWFSVIDDMTKAFYSEHKILPNETQAWQQLIESPPSGYNIKYKKDNDSLEMPGVKLLKRKDFNARWQKYTTK